MTEDRIEDVITDIKKLSRIYWKIGLLIILGLFIGIIAGTLVFLWQIFSALSLSYPDAIGDWTLILLINFGASTAFWELIIVGIPGLAIGLGLFYYWWTRLEEEDKRDFFSSDPRSRQRWMERIIAGISLGVGVIIIGLTFLFNVTITGHLTAPIGSWTIQYVLQTFIITGIISLAIVGVPALVIAFIYWYSQIYRSKDLV